MTLDSPAVTTPSAPLKARDDHATFIAVAFHAERGRFFRMCLGGAGLLLVTAGFYRFWLATDIRRHLWSRTVIDGDALEYTGRGKELLIGFLIALAIIVPINLGYFLLGLEAERLKAFASVPLVLFYALFGQFAVYRARRYRLTRTVWRGVRFWMTGSGWKYAFRWAGWALLTLLTFGLAFPWMSASLERYKLRHTWYGNLQGDFEGRGSDFFRKGIFLWCFPALFLAGAIVMFVQAGFPPRADPVKLAGGGGAVSMALLAGVLLLPSFRAVQWRWWADGVRFGKTSLKCSLTGGELFWLYLKFLFAAMGLLIVVGSLAFTIGVAVAAALGLKGGPQLGMPLIFLSALGYLVLLLALGILQRYFLVQNQWALILPSLSIVSPEDLEQVSAEGAPANALGEGFADSLDIAGF